MSKKFTGSDRLDTTSESGERVFVYPDDPKGWYRNLRTKVYLILMSIFLLLPWVKINGYPAILIDISQRHFVFFGFSFWCQ